MAEKLKEYQVNTRGKGSSSFTVGLPKVWIDDNGLQHGDLLDVLRDSSGRYGSDVLIIRVHANGE